MDGSAWTRRGLLPLAGVAAFAPRLASAEGPPPTPISAPAQQTIQGGQDLSDRLTAPVLINGAGPYPFLIDTGAERSALSHELAEALVLPMEAAIRVHGVAGEIMAPGVTVTTMQVGSHLLSNLHLPLLAEGDLGAPGVLGIDAVHDQVVLLDFVRQRMSIEPARLSARHSDEIVVSARSRFGQLVLVDSSFHERPVLVVIDTGAEVSLGNEALRNWIVRGERSNGKTDILSVTGQNTTGDWAVASSLRVGGISIHNIPVVFSDLHSFRIWRLADEPALLLGMDVLRKFETVQIDFANREVRFRVPPPRRLHQQFGRQRIAHPRLAPSLNCS